jgi:hypothetical protein
MKLCRICNTEKPLDAFSKDRSKPDGLCFKCKACRRAYDIDRNRPGPKVNPEEIQVAKIDLTLWITLKIIGQTGDN